MATITSKLTLDSTTVSANETLGLSVVDTLTVGAPSNGLSQISVSNSGKSNILENNSAATYVYLKNTDNTNFIKLFNDTDQEWGILHPGEFAFFPVGTAVGLRCQADTAACLIDYAYWTKA
tara:strand:- start:3730 stop:4092 length:363 start_codon:yes stop_codon:yes gene_type:complete